MPYMIQKDGNKFKVFKQGADKQPEGDALGTHDTEAQAKDQLAALYANEGKTAQPVPMAGQMVMTKIDVAKRQVFFKLDQTPDEAGDKMHYASSKPNFVNWSNMQKQATGGKSLGNVRVMHRNQEAGRVIFFEPDDAGHALLFGCEIDDEDAWQKVLKGTFTGGSPGGSMAKWADPLDPPHNWYTAYPVEVSLGDKPSNPNAVFSMIKTAGGQEVQMTLEQLRKEAGATPPPAAPAAPAAEPAKADAQKPDPEGIKLIVLQVLKDLGLVQETSAAPAAPSALAAIAEIQKIVDPVKEPLSKLAAGLVSLEAMGKNVEALTKDRDALRSDLAAALVTMTKQAEAIKFLQDHPSQGPVLWPVNPKVLGEMQPAADQLEQTIQVLRKTAEAATDPRERQILLDKVGLLEIQKAQLKPNPVKS